MRLPRNRLCPPNQVTASRWQWRRATAVTVMLAASLSCGLRARDAGGQEEAAGAQRARPGRPGKIYLMTVGDDVMRGAVAVDPNDGTWRKIASEPHQQARVSPDGRKLAIRRFLRGEPDPGLWIYDTTG